MDNVLIVSLLFWPQVVVVCAALNMLISWTFSWAELIFDVMIGVLAGYFLYAGIQPDPHPAVTFFFVFSHGVPAIAWWLTDGFATLGTGMDPAAFIGWMALLRVGAVFWTAGFDRISTLLGARLGWGAFFFSFVVAPAKLMFATFTSAVGFLIWLAGLFWAFGDGRASFAGGVLLTEFKPGSATNYHATTQAKMGRSMKKREIMVGALRQTAGLGADAALAGFGVHGTGVTGCWGWIF